MLRATILVLLFAAGLCAQKPNVVLIIGDDQGFGDFGFMGHAVILTPHLDRLAQEGALFSYGYVPAPLCRPSLASLVTGRWPHRHGITGNDPGRRVDRQRMVEIFAKSVTVPQALAKLGYRSFQSGKWWEGHSRVGGFTAGMTHGDVERQGRHGDEGLKIGRQGLQPIFDFIENGKQDQPFFVWYAPFLPHTPHNPPARLLNKYRTSGRSEFVVRYFAMCEWFDETCGELLGYLEEKELEESTLVLFVTDNGWIQREKQAGYAQLSKRSPYEGGVRTPIMVKWPGRLPPGRHDVPVSSIDLVPTLLRACGAEVPESCDGVDLMPICTGIAKERGPVFGAAFTHDVVELGAPAKSVKARYVVNGSWKLVWHQDGVAARYDEAGRTGERSGLELFDLSKDPHEGRNLADAHPEKVAALKQLIEGWWALD